MSLLTRINTWAGIVIVVTLLVCLCGCAGHLAAEDDSGEMVGASSSQETHQKQEDKASPAVTEGEPGEKTGASAEDEAAEAKWVMTKKWESDSFGMEYTEYEYNEQWLQTSETTYELSYVCDEDSGQLTPVQGEVLKGWSKEYDDKGNPVLFEQYDYEYDQWSLHEYDNVYDGQGRLQSMTVSQIGEDGVSELDRWEEREYYEDGTLKRLFQATPSGEEFCELYDEEGRSIDQQRFNEDGSLHYHMQNEYDEEGRQIAHIMMTGDGSYGIEQSWVQDYDADGRLLRKEIISDDVVFDYEYVEARDFSLRLARTEDESGDDHYAVMDGSGNVIYRSANSSAASMAELFIYDENGKQAGEVCFDGGAPAITQYSYVDEWGNEIAKRSIDAKNDSDFVRVCEWMNTQTGEVRQSDDLLEFEQEHNYLGSYVSLERFGTDPAKECLGVWGYSNGIVAFREDGTCVRSFSNAFQEGVWSLRNGEVTATFGEDPTEYVLRVSETDRGCASLGGGYAADIMVHMSRGL